MSHPGFGVGAGGPPQIAPEQPTQLEATVIGSSPPMDELLPTQPHPPIIQVQNAQVEDPGTEPVATLQTRYLVCLQKEIRGGIREAEIATQYDGLVKAIVVCQEGSETLPPKASKGRMEPPVEPKGSPDFSHIDLVTPTPAQNMPSKC